MSAMLYAFVEPLIVTLIVAFSAAIVLRKHAPKIWTRLTGRAGAGSCHEGGETSVVGNSKNCGSGCGTCGNSRSGPQVIKLRKARH